MASDPPTNALPTPSSPAEPPETQSLHERFQQICATTAAPTHHPATLLAPEEELRYLVQNDAGEVFLSPDAVWHNDHTTRPAILSALRTAFRHACEGCDIDLFPDDGGEHTEASGDTPGNEHADDTDSADADDMYEHGRRQTFCSMLGIPDFKPIQELRSLTWANSESKKIIDAFNEETDRIRVERLAREAAEDARLMSNVPRAPPKPVQPLEHDPVVWAAQEVAASSSVLRDLRARGKKGLWGTKSTKLRPEAAAEMARARVAAAAAAAVMRDQHRGEGLVRAETVEGDFLERFVKGKRDGDFFPIHAKAFQRALSLDSDPDGKKKKKVSFADDTFTKKE